MSNIKDYVEIIAASCDECGGVGFLFWGNEYNYDVEPCSCVDEISDELTLDWVNN